MRRQRWTAAALLSLASVASPQKTVSYEQTRRALSEYARRAGALGVSGVLLVAEGDSVLLHAPMGWRDPARQRLIDTSSLFYIASLSKQFVAAAVLKLEDDGRLRTTDSIAKFIPDAPADKRSITIDELLRHTSGLPQYGFDLERRDWSVQSRIAAVRGILDQPLSQAPGSAFSYQNTNYIILTAIVEAVAGTSLESYLDSALFKPAGVRDTYIGSRVTPALRNRIVWSVGDAVESFMMVDRPSSYLRLGRGTFTTAGDLFRWMRALATGRVLSDGARRKLFSIGIQFQPGYGYGAGWFVRADSSGRARTVFHGGDLGGYHSEARLSPPSGRILIALTNSAYRGRSITEAILNHVTDIAFHGGENPLPQVAAERRSAVPQLVGEYSSQKADGLVLVARGSSVEVSANGQRAVDWLLTSDSSNWNSRHRDAAASMALVDLLSRGQSAPAPSGRLLPATDQTELLAEWSRMHKHGGRLKSYQLLGAVSEGDGKSATVIRLVFERDSLLFGVGWNNDTLAYTAPGIGHRVSPAVFAPLADGSWGAYDWLSETPRRLSFNRASTSDSSVVGLTLETSNGPVFFARRTHE